LESQANGNINARLALISDAIYQPSDFYFRCPLSPKRRLAGESRVAAWRAVAVGAGRRGPETLEVIYVRMAQHVLFISC